jgi:HEPN domain-containing protein
MSLTQLDLLLNDFAFRSFRDVADEDYIAARMSIRCGLVVPFLWSSQQTIEKYLKCILLLNRIKATDVRHDLGKALKRINTSNELKISLSRKTSDFIQYLDDCAVRYLEVSNVAYGTDIVTLDRAVWELRRFAGFDPEPRQLQLKQGAAAPVYRMSGGKLEKIMDKADHPARKPLLLQNAFFGKRSRRFVRAGTWLSATNAPLYLHPEILPEVMKYAIIPNNIVEAYRDHVGTHALSVLL